MYRGGKYMIVYNTIYGGLYDKDEKTGNLSKVLRCYHDNSVTFDRFDFADNGEYKEATNEFIDKWQCTYYLEDGSRPFKKKNCKGCLIEERCNHNQKFYDKTVQ
jgi:hypothetical protein